MKSDSSDQVSAWLNQAAEHLQQGKASAANRLLKQTLSPQPHPGLARGLELWRGGQSRQAARTLTEYSAAEPEDFRPLQVRAHIAIQAGAIDEAIALLQQCLALHSGIMALRPELSRLLMRRQRYAEALEQLNFLLEEEPEKQEFLLLKAALLDRSGQYQPAIELLQRVIRQQQELAQPPTELAASFTALAMIQRTVGDQAAAIQSLQQAISHDPHSGWPWFQLADFKVYNFQTQQIEQIEGGLKQARPGSMNEVHFAFALGRALESQQAFGAAFAAYAHGNRVRAALAPFDLPAHLRELGAIRALFEQPQNHPITQSAQTNYPADCPAIFVVGLPRSGTTLVDQIITAHSAVDGTMELSIISTLIRELQQRQLKAGQIPYPAPGTQLPAEELRGMGNQYLQRASIQRADAPFFVDKMPFNFQHIGLIRKILPGARIINVRRQPMALGFSVYRQLFRFGQDWAFDLKQIAQYWLAYEDLMRFWDRLMPGQVIHVQYEELVQWPEQSIQKLLQQLYLPEQPACFRPHENQRAVRTASSEQVRQALFTDAIDYWQNFAQQLRPLRDALDHAAVA
ncbi:MAG: sulfotransferase [Xanthomonadales bacterium]|nr:sulfotransferase [Xanthomonadales bacterium]